MVASYFGEKVLETCSHALCLMERLVALETAHDSCISLLQVSFTPEEVSYKSEYRGIQGNLRNLTLIFEQLGRKVHYFIKILIMKANIIQT